MESNKDDNIQNTGIKDIPEWLNANLFEEFLLKDFPTFCKVKKFTIKPAVSTGENFMTVMLRILIDFELKNKTSASISYMAKIKPAPEKMQEMVKEWKIFAKEHNTYTKYIPKFESYYQNAGRQIQLAPRFLEPTKCQINDDVLILEDLRLRGFKNFNRHLGLDMQHTKAVLQKLAQFHAASAHHFVKEGPYLDIYERNLSSDIDMHEGHRLKMAKLFNENFHLYGQCEGLKEKLKIYQQTQPDPMQLKSDWKTNSFNVLNHGDSWTNNIMFQYDNKGQLKKTLLIDFQISRYGSPAEDLYYFILTSTNLEVKVKCFDYFICYYHKQLVDHLKLLKYGGRIPTLKDIHLELFKHDYWAYLTIGSIMPVILCESRDDANVDALLNEDNDDLKKSMFSNDLYVKNMRLLLPWLNNRGAFDVEESTK